MILFTILIHDNSFDDDGSHNTFFWIMLQGSWRKRIEKILLHGVTCGVVYIPCN